jgi:outer membrane immunogenic protein
MMRRISLSLLAATAMGLIASQAASAADLGVRKAPPPAPLPPPVQDWSGIYVGLEGGYGWGRLNFGTAFDPFCTFSDFGCNPDASTDSRSQSGWLFGGFVGAQKQWGSWVLGIEADFDAADIKGSTTVTRSQTFGTLTVTDNLTANGKTDELGTVRGKVGWAWSPNWMIYATGGMAWAHVKGDASFSESTFDSGCGCSNVFGDDFSLSGAGGASMFGWTVGAGLDWKWQIDNGSAWVFGVEYLHYEFPDNTLSLADNVFGSGASFSIPNTSERIDVVKGRISYLFSIH